MKLSRQDAATNLTLAGLIASGTALALERPAESLDLAELTLNALVLNADAAKAGLASLAGAKLSVPDLALAMPDGGAELTGKAIDLSLIGAILRDPMDGAVNLLQLDNAALSGASLSSADRLVTVDKLLLEQARAALWIDDKGALNLAERFAPGTAVAKADGSGASGQGSAPAAPSPASKPWRVVVKDAVLTSCGRLRGPAPFTAACAGPGRDRRAHHRARYRCRGADAGRGARVAAQRRHTRSQGSAGAAGHCGRPADYRQGHCTGAGPVLSVGVS